MLDFRCFQRHTNTSLTFVLFENLHSTPVTEPQRCYQRCKRKHSAVKMGPQQLLYVTQQCGTVVVRNAQYLATFLPRLCVRILYTVYNSYKENTRCVTNVLTNTTFINVRYNGLSLIQGGTLKCKNISYLRTILQPQSHDLNFNKFFYCTNHV